MFRSSLTRELLHFKSCLYLRRLRAVIYSVIGLLCYACAKQRRNETFTAHYRNYYYRLLAFDEKKSVQQGQRLLMSASFSTQNDSVFWDSENNLGGVYVLSADTSKDANLLQYHAGLSSPGDSVCLLVPSNVFFKQFFATEQLPFFSGKDSIVKVNFKIKKVLSPDEEEVLEMAGAKREHESIKAHFKDEKAYEMARDELGFFWIERPDTSGGGVTLGSPVRLGIKASFLNGRSLDPFEQVIAFQYGTPDQVLPGLNNVMSRLKVGQNAKIILPSRLAFGEFGSSNGTVPPFTPLVFELRLLADELH